MTVTTYYRAAGVKKPARVNHDEFASVLLGLAPLHIRRRTK